MKNKVLLAEDDQELGNNIKNMIESDHFDVCFCLSGEQALELFDQSFDIVILDIVLPGISGIDVCRIIRSQSDVPILFLTGKSEDTDKVIGFSSGADDYLTKPFSYMELLARIKALIRRIKRYEDEYVIKSNTLNVNTLKNEVYKNGHPIRMTKLEIQLLIYLMSHSNEAVNASDIYENVWHEHFYASNHNTVMVHIRSLRQKIEDNPNDPQYIKTVWGKGYEFEDIS